ncbi:hypothetical protein B0I35DRAFT_406854 [Stachybotrys elegans]|uniref:Uncharacterized protein n=1 Tax=Stachybotrys elegans TaxID=80388 RepID=A0A8K0WVK2_9HYPO|nr:hypothetical protein B0I35DRAFT_406854 [Stachybotrys elegans]
MAHLLRDQVAIFSPSVARIAASTAREWSYIDSWLASKFPGQPVPSFERNPETLKALLALSNFNEAADEERQLLTRADAAALEELNESTTQEASTPSMRDELLDAVERDLPKEGQSSLDALALMSVRAGMAFPQPQSLGSHLVALQADLYETEQMKARVEILQRHVQHETSELDALLRHLQSDSYKPHPDMAKQNLDMQRKLKTMASQLPELQDRVATLATTVDSSHPTLDDIVLQERDYEALLAQKKELDMQLAAFQGLPSDPDMARSELDDLRRHLRGISGRRDALFEDLVERESPVKRR